jgi:hypothetical protein
VVQVSVGSNPGCPDPGRRRVLRDPEADAVLAVSGAVTLPFFSAEELDDLRSRLDQLDLFGDSGFYDTASVGLAVEQRQAVHETLCVAFEDRARELLIDHRPIMSSVLTKWPGVDSDKEIHRDFRLVDEPTFRSVCLWVPFIDVDAYNGALAVLPGSHLVDSGPRTVPITPSVPADPVQRLRFADLDTVPAAAGEAVVFDMAVAHGSDVNRSSVPRPAVAVAFAPRDAELSLSFCHPDDSIELLEVVDPELFRRIDWKVRPGELRSLGTLDGPWNEIPVADLIRRSREASSGRDVSLASERSG